MTDLALKWIPRFDFGDDSIELTYPVTRWRPGARTEGMWLDSIVGIPGPSLRLRKYLLDLVLRFREDEWELVKAFMEYAQTGESFRWFPRAYDDAVPESLTVFLEEPRVDRGIVPARDSTIIWMFTQPLTISRMSTPWNVEYFRIPIGG